MVTLYVKRNARGCWMNSVMAGMASAPAGTVARAYAANRRAAIESIAEADPLATCVRGLMIDRTTWTGSASDLLRLCAERARADISSGEGYAHPDRPTRRPFGVFPVTQIDRGPWSYLDVR
jgi:hypothetical protein